MVDKEQALEILKSFTKDVLQQELWYQAVKPSIKATLLYGSVAKAMNKMDSDIDILIILPLEMEEKHTSGEYFYDYRGQKVNVVLRAMERLRKIAEEHNDAAQREVFKDSVIIDQADGEVGMLLKKIATI